MKEWVELTDYIRELLLEGKKSPDKEFQLLFRLYGEFKIRGIVQKILKEKKA